MSAPALHLDSVSITIGDKLIVNDIDLHLNDGESLALVGESGSGKSMTLRSIVRRLPDAARVTGTVLVEGAPVATMSRSQIRELRANTIGMVFQDPRAHINPVRTIGDFLTEALVLNRRLSRTDAIARAVAALRDVGVSDGTHRLAQYPHELSGGLLQRVMIASVLLAEARIILADEPTTALDVTTQEEVVALLNELRSERGMAMIMVSHDLELASAVCDRTAVMYAGSIVEVAPSTDLHATAMHPYTVALFDARPDPTSRDSILRSIPGRPIAAYEATTACAFAPRCARATATCQTQDPQTVRAAGGRAACFFPEMSHA